MMADTLTALATAAIRYAQAGLHVLPLRPRAKEPLTANGLKDASNDPATVATWWERWPDANIGIACAPSGLVVVDIDRHGDTNGFDTVRELEKHHGFMPDCPIQATGGGGKHRIYRARPGARYPGKLGDGVDLKHQGYIVVDPSIHPSGAAYTWQRTLRRLADVPDAPPWMERHEKAVSEGRVSNTTPGLDWHEVQDALRAIPSEDRDTWLQVGMALHSTGHQSARPVWDAWSSSSAKYQEADQEKTWRSFKGGSTTAATIFALAQRHGWRNPKARENRPATPARDHQIPPVEAYTDLPAAAGRTAPPSENFFSDAPVPLPDDLAPVEPFDLAMLPDALRPWLADIAERMQCPPDYLAATAMAALAVAVGRRIGVRPKRHDDWTVIPNMWACIVGPPGVMKSPAQTAVLDPLKRLDAIAFEEHQTAKAEAEAHAELAGMRLEARKKKAAKALAANPRAMVDVADIIEDAPELPAMKRYLVHDATVEKLADVCAGNPQGVGAYRDELVGLLRSLDKEGQESARGFYLTAWNGDAGYMVDRIGRGHQRIEAVCLSVIGSTQPGRISEYLASAVKDTAANDGLIQRFGLLVWPDLPKRWENVDRWPDAEHKQRAFTLFERLAVADPVAAWGAEPVTGHDGEIDATTPPVLRLDDDALQLFTAWRTDLEHELRAGDLHPALESHLSKYRKLVPGLALLLHLADGGHGPVSRVPMVKALAWAHYLRSHATRAYGSVTNAEACAAKALLARIRRGDVQDSFTAREVLRKRWAKLGDLEAVKAAVTMLTDYGWIASRVVDTPGRPRTEYCIHPEALT